ncbi:MAG: histidine kinase [Clostridia bacterium]|nr:histidine kinase [Clostridia bacterium]
MRRTLLIYSAVMLAAVFIVVSFFAIRQNYKEYEANAEDKTINLAETINRDLYLLINKSSNIVNNTDILNGLEVDYSDDIYAVMQFYDELEQHFFSQQDVNIRMNPGVIIYPSNPTLPGGTFVTRQEEAKNADFIQDMKDAEDLFVWRENAVPTMVSESGEDIFAQYISLYRNIFYFDRYLGCLELRIPVSVFDEYLRGIKPEEDETIRIVSAKEKEMLLADKKYISYTDDLLCGYSVVFQKSRPAFFGELAAMVFIYFIAFALIFLLIMVTSRISADSLTREIYAFLDSIYDDRTVSGEKNTHEVNLLKEKFVELIEKERVASESLFKANQEKRTLEIEMLQNRINPHLLYNSLSAIKWRLIRKKDYEFASLMDALSNYYRIVLNKGNSIITIENEINMIKEYVRINRFLQENAFEFSVVADTEVLQHHIFKLLLQPFVENSIKHGIANRRDGKIVLEVQDLGEDIRFIITDNGYGMSEEVLSGLLNNTAVVPNSGGYGLYNTQKRIRNCYGDNYGIMIKSAVGEGTVVTVTAAKLDEEELKKRISI